MDKKTHGFIYALEKCITRSFQLISVYIYYISMCFLFYSVIITNTHSHNIEMVFNEFENHINTIKFYYEDEKLIANVIKSTVAN